MGGAYGSLYAFCEVYQVPNGTEIAEGEMKYACFQFSKMLVLNFICIFSSLGVSFLLLDWRMIIRKESTKYFIRQTKQVGGGMKFKYHLKKTIKPILPRVVTYK